MNLIKTQHLNNKFSFYKCETLSLKSKNSFPVKFFNDLNNFNKLKTQKEKTHTQKKVHYKASELYNYLLEFFFDKYNDFRVAKRKKIKSNYNPNSLMLDTYEYKKWYEK